MVKDLIFLVMNFYSNLYKVFNSIFSMRFSKRGQLELINIISGLLLVAGGLVVIFNYVNFGLLLSGLAVVIEAVKIVMNQGLKSRSTDIQYDSFLQLLG